MLKISISTGLAYNLKSMLFDTVVMWEMTRNSKESENYRIQLDAYKWRD